MQETWVQSLGREDPLEEDGNPLQHSCLDSSMDRGAWWATVHGIAKSRIWLSDQHFDFAVREARLCKGSHQAQTHHQEGQGWRRAWPQLRCSVLSSLLCCRVPAPFSPLRLHPMLESRPFLVVVEGLCELARLFPLVTIVGSHLVVALPPPSSILGPLLAQHLTAGLLHSLTAWVRQPSAPPLQPLPCLWTGQRLQVLPLPSDASETLPHDSCWTPQRPRLGLSEPPRAPALFPLCLFLILLDSTREGKANARGHVVQPQLCFPFMKPLTPHRGTGCTSDSCGRWLHL